MLRPVPVSLTLGTALVLAALIVLAIVPAAVAQDRAAAEAAFRSWLEAKVWPDAQKAGVSRPTFDRGIAGLSLDWDLPELSPPGRPLVPEEQRQAEFQSPAAYFATLPGLAARGRALLAGLDGTLDGIERRWGVPREIVVAIWGRESGFGAVAPKRQALRVLATQAFMGRRKALYYPELVAAFVILEEDHLPGETLLSSWAGAMGQPQFLPSKFLAYAVDGDGDGRRDIWRSTPDVLASIAHYLKEHGWRPERAWGAEVKVPASVSCALEGPKQGRPMRDWAAAGIVRADGAPIEASAQAGYLLMPAGRSGPAFLVSENFYVLKSYNESDLYALFIAHAADRMRGAASFGPWSKLDTMKRGDVRALQERMKGMGYDVGRVDGLVGFATRTAIGLWQERNGRPATCFPDTALLNAIR